jgi:hypothetical protein
MKLKTDLVVEQSALNVCRYTCSSLRFPTRSAALCSQLQYENVCCLFLPVCDVTALSFAGDRETEFRYSHIKRFSFRPAY